MRLSSVLLLCVLLAGCGEPEKSGFKPSSGAWLPPSQEVNTMAFSPDGKLLLVDFTLHNETNQNYKNLILFDVNTGEKYWEQKGPKGGIIFAPDGETVKIIGKEKMTSLNWKNGTETDSLLINQKMMQISDDLTLAITGQTDQQNKLFLYLYDVNQKQSIRELTSTYSRINCVSMSPGKRYVLFGFQPCPDNKLLLFVMMELSTGKTLWSIKGVNLADDIGIFSPNGKQVLVSGSEEDDKLPKTRLYLKDVVTGETIRRFEGHDVGIKSMAFTPDGRFIHALDHGGILKKWNAEDGIEEWSLQVPYGRIFFSPNSKLACVSSGVAGSGSITTASTEIRLTIWDLENKRQIRTLVPK